MTLRNTRMGMKTQKSTFDFLNPRYADDKNSFGPRVHFNHGYHDAHFDIEHNSIRELSETIHDTKHVSPTFDVMYFEGYKAGLAETNYAGNSQNAWETFRQGNLTDDQLREVFQAEVIAYMSTWPKKERNDRMLANARKEASLVCGVM